MKDKLDNLENLKESEFSDLLKKVNFTDDENNPKYDEDGDLIKKEFANEDKKLNLGKYIAISTGFIYTLSAPVILLLVIYYLLEKYVLLRRAPMLLIFFIIIGLITGYWSLFKEIRK